MSSTKAKSNSRRRGDNEAKENVSPAMRISTKTTKKTQTPKVSDEEVESRASTTLHSDDSKNDLGLTIPRDVQPNSAEDSDEDSMAFEELRKKTRRALRDTSGVAPHRDVLASAVGKTSAKEPKGDFLLQFSFYRRPGKSIT
uniref:Uncharacterized protein n=1 Tax=Parascaris equorum TaxID=6256 RepID=A0A914S5M5_PAREQ